MYKEVHEDSSTESTYKLPTEVEFRKRSNEQQASCYLDILFNFLENSFNKNILEESTCYHEVLANHTKNIGNLYFGSLKDLNDALAE